MHPTSKVSKRGAGNRVRLLDAAVACGMMSVARARKQLPLITSFAWQTTGSGAYGKKPDDDFALAIDGLFITDNRNNVGMGYTPTYNEANAKRYPGSFFEVFTFDGWPSSWFHLKWQVDLIFSTGEQFKFEGGSNSDATASSIEAPSPIPPNYFERPQKINDHYRNGSGVLPLPESWPWPKFLGDKRQDYQLSEYTTSGPKNLNPLPLPNG